MNERSARRRPPPSPRDYLGVYINFNLRRGAGVCSRRERRAEFVRVAGHFGERRCRSAATKLRDRWVVSGE